MYSLVRITPHRVASFTTYSYDYGLSLVMRHILPMFCTVRADFIVSKQLCTFHVGAAGDDMQSS